MKKITNEKLIGKAKKRSWDDLAGDIIVLENSIRKEKNAKSLILLKNKLKRWEKEKSDRLFSNFDMKTFLNKNNEEFEVEYSTKTTT
jgi:hypothetical protein